MQNLTEPKQPHIDRFLSDKYFTDLLTIIINNIKYTNYKIVVVSDGNIDILKKSFNGFDNIRYIINKPPYETILSLIFNDIFISSPSGLSIMIENYGIGIQINQPKIWCNQYTDNKINNCFFLNHNINWDNFNNILDYNKNHNICMN